MIEITAANYIIAWVLLQKRYENKKLIVKSHIDALFAVEPLKQENHESLCHLISEYERYLQMLDKIVLLSTTLVRVSDKDENAQLARVLLDSCSKYCFVTTSLAQVNIQKLAIPYWVNLADPDFHEPGPTEIIIGAEYYYDLHLEDKMKITDDCPMLQRTVFSFSELESCNNFSTLSVEGTVCEEHFEKTTLRDTEGRFVVTLPKIEHHAIALKRLHGMERRFAVNGQLKALYVEFVQEYLAMNHMRQVDDEDTAKPSYYLPHSAVLKPDSTTTKLRVMFDASCRSTTRVSLNDGLMVGPVVQDDSRMALASSTHSCSSVRSQFRQKYFCSSSGNIN
ncbi:uncharacterized protein LOC134202996 [Armigeres subalbatus]|uniref:uncharacterized protein LOC134202996 n=1 Tax=Armigeres subalbatus TaxID=124917 RepID=UPI002ED46813